MTFRFHSGLFSELPRSSMSEKRIQNAISGVLHECNKRFSMILGDPSFCRIFRWAVETRQVERYRAGERKNCSLIIRFLYPRVGKVGSRTLRDECTSLAQFGQPNSGAKNSSHTSAPKCLDQFFKLTQEVPNSEFYSYSIPFQNAQVWNHAMQTRSHVPRTDNTISLNHLVLNF